MIIIITIDIKKVAKGGQHTLDFYSLFHNVFVVLLPECHSNLLLGCKRFHKIKKSNNGEKY